MEPIRRACVITGLTVLGATLSACAAPMTAPTALPTATSRWTAPTTTVATTAATTTTTPPLTTTTVAPPPPAPPAWPAPAPKTTRAPNSPHSAAPQSKPAPSCDPNYSGCVPIDSDVDCAGGSGNGPSYVQGPVRVIGTDIYKLDADNDG